MGGEAGQHKQQIEIKPEVNKNVASFDNGMDYKNKRSLELCIIWVLSLDWSRMQLITALDLVLIEGHYVNDPFCIGKFHIHSIVRLSTNFYLNKFHVNKEWLLNYVIYVLLHEIVSSIIDAHIESIHWKWNEVGRARFYEVWKACEEEFLTFLMRIMYAHQSGIVLWEHKCHKLGVPSHVIFSTWAKEAKTKQVVPHHVWQLHAWFFLDGIEWFLGTVHTQAYVYDFGGFMMYHQAHKIMSMILVVLCGKAFFISSVLGHKSVAHWYSNKLLSHMF